MVDLGQHSDLPPPDRGSGRAPTADANGPAAGQKSEPPARPASGPFPAAATRARARGTRDRSRDRRSSSRNQGQTEPPPAASEKEAPAADARRSRPADPTAPSAHRARSKDQQPPPRADMPVMAGTLQSQELLVEGGELTHLPLPPISVDTPHTPRSACLTSLASERAKLNSPDSGTKSRLLEWRRRESNPRKVPSVVARS